MHGALFEELTKITSQSTFVIQSRILWDFLWNVLRNDFWKGNIWFQFFKAHQIFPSRLFLATTTRGLNWWSFLQPPNIVLCPVLSSLCNWNCAKVLYQTLYQILYSSIVPSIAASIVWQPKVWKRERCSSRGTAAASYWSESPPRLARAPSHNQLGGKYSPSLRTILLPTQKLAQKWKEFHVKISEKYSLQKGRNIEDRPRAPLLIINLVGKAPPPWEHLAQRAIKLKSRCFQNPWEVERNISENTHFEHTISKPVLVHNMIY